MFYKYDIIEYDKNYGCITYRFNDDNNKLVKINIETEYPNYEPCYDYYFDKDGELVRIPESNGEDYYIKENVKFTKCYQYQLDKYNSKYPICSNGLLYKKLFNIYNSLYSN